MKTITTTLSIFALLLSTAGFSGVKREIESKTITVKTKMNVVNLLTDIEPRLRPLKPSM